VGTVIEKEDVHKRRGKNRRNGIGKVMEPLAWASDRVAAEMKAEVPNESQSGEKKPG